MLQYLSRIEFALVRDMFESPMKVVEVCFCLEIELMEEIHERECEGRMRTRMRRREPSYAEQLGPMKLIAFVVIVATTERHVDGVYARKIDDDEVFQSALRVSARSAKVPEMHTKACFAQAGLRVEVAIPYLNIDQLSDAAVQVITYLYAMQWTVVVSLHKTCSAQRSSLQAVVTTMITFTFAAGTTDRAPLALGRRCATQELIEIAVTKR